MQISQKRFEIEAWYELPTNRKWPMADRMMTSSMTSRDLESLRYRLSYYGASTRNLKTANIIVKKL